MTVRDLVFDADDTLWENNIVFEAVIERFIHLLGPAGADRAAARGLLDRIEHENSLLHGYGCAVFERSLLECLTRLRGTGDGDGDAAMIAQLCRPIREHQVDLLPGVRETLSVLSARHRLFLLTKGDRDEQQRKIDASGLAGFFEDVVIVAAKNEQTYRDLVLQRGLDRERTWMIGNSPRSDILPALAAGLGAVLVPHPATWSLEQQTLPPAGARLSIVDHITHLVDLFESETS